MMKSTDYKWDIQWVLTNIYMCVPTITINIWDSPITPQSFLLPFRSPDAPPCTSFTLTTTNPGPRRPLFRRKTSSFTLCMIILALAIFVDGFYHNFCSLDSLLRVFTVNKWRLCSTLFLHLFEIMCVFFYFYSLIWYSICLDF